MRIIEIRRLVPVQLALLAILPGQVTAEDEVILEEILVTAQKREQSLQEVPIAVNAFDSEFLRITGAQTLDNLEPFTPGLEATNLNVTQPTYKIRGIGTGGLSIGTDPAVGVYIDGVYVGRSGSSNMEFTDIERVEVLKGPQGTLFGRNAAAGAIQIITQRPTDEFEGFLRGRVGNYNKRLLEGAVNVPLADNWSARFNAIGSRRDGFIDNALGGDDWGDQGYRAGRASILWTPGDVTDVRYTFDINRLDQQAPHAIGLNPELSVTGGDVFGPIANDVINNEEKRELFAHTLQIVHDFDWSTMTLVSSYREFESNAREDEDGVAIANAYLDTENIEDNEQLYLELRFNGDSDAVSWVGGLSYYQEDGKQTANVNSNVGSLVRNGYHQILGDWIIPDESDCQNLSGLVLGGSYPCTAAWTESMNNKANTQSMAAFGDITWRFADKWSAILGLRYTRDEKDFEWYNPPNSLTGNPENDQIFGFAGATVPPEKYGPVKADNSWSNWDPRAVINFHPSDDVLLFLSYANGYTAGGFNSLQVGSEFDPEEVDNLELGIKSEWLERRLRFNSSVYHYIYSNKQDIELVVNPDGINTYNTVTGDAKGSGLEAELSWLPIAPLRLGLNYGYLNAEWTDREVNGIDLKGQSLEGPRQRAVFLADYDLGLGSAGSLVFHFDLSWTSAKERNEASADYDIDYETKDDAYTLSNARISWFDVSASWQVALWAENLFDTEHVVGYNGISADDLDTPYVRRNHPRFYGLELIYNW